MRISQARQIFFLVFLPSIISRNDKFIVHKHLALVFYCAVCMNLFTPLSDLSIWTYFLRFLSLLCDSCNGSYTLLYLEFCLTPSIVASKDFFLI